MNLVNDINASARWLNECYSRIDGADLNDNTRNRVSACLLHLALEHHGAIQVLVNSNPPHYGSAMALLRPQFECYVRGLWIHRCASDQDIENFINGNEPPKINVLIQAIEALPDYSGGMLMETKQGIWREFCGLTHGGSTQVASRSCATEIASDYTEEQVRGLLGWACSTTLVISIAFANLLNDNVMANELLSVYREMFPQEA